MNDPTDGRPPFPFIVGCGRSGTTLFRAMLDSHPELAVPAETKFIVTMAGMRRRYEGRSGFQVSPFVRDLYKYTDLAARWGIPRERLAAEFDADRPKDYPNAVRRIFAMMARDRGKPRYANKTPKHVLSMMKLLDLFPEARFIHVIRDGRNVALSYLESDFGPDTLEGMALYWKQAVTHGRSAGRRLGAARYHEIRYEELLREPELVLTGVCRFIGLEYDPVMLSYHERADDVIEGIRFPRYHQRLRLPPTTGMRSWRSEMTDDDVARFESLAGRTLERFGYERAIPKPALATVLTARRRAVMEEARRVKRAVFRRLGVASHGSRPVSSPGSVREERR